MFVFLLNFTQLTISWKIKRKTQCLKIQFGSQPCVRSSWPDGPLPRGLWKDDTRWHTSTSLHYQHSRNVECTRHDINSRLFTYAEITETFSERSTWRRDRIRHSINHRFVSLLIIVVTLNWKTFLRSPNNKSRYASR